MRVAPHYASKGNNVACIVLSTQPPMNITLEMQCETLEEDSPNHTPNHLPCSLLVVFAKASIAHNEGFEQTCALKAQSRLDLIVVLNAHCKQDFTLKQCIPAGQSQNRQKNKIK